MKRNRKYFAVKLCWYEMQPVVTHEIVVTETVFLDVR